MVNRVFLLLLTLFMFSCSTDRNNREERLQDFSNGFIQEEIKYATGFDVRSREEYFLLSLFDPFRDVGDTLHFIVGDPGTEVFPPEYQQIKTPVNDVVLLASPHATFLQELDGINIVRGISSSAYFFNKHIQAGVKQGEISELGFGQNLNIEKLMVLNPEMMIFNGMSSSDAIKYAPIAEAGIMLFPAAEWRENHPLGRAEWIKVFGLLTGKYELSVKIFSEIESRYQELKQTEKPEQKPSVIVNAPYKDVWWVPGGDSYMSRLISDAGARYLWDDNKETGGVQIDIERVFHTAHEADFWISPSHYGSLGELISADRRFREFDALKKGKVYNNDRRRGPQGGNDYHEAGLVRPDIVLADLIKIFHPEALPEHSLYFYRKLPE